jgi:hypothetical protein
MTGSTEIDRGRTSQRGRASDHHLDHHQHGLGRKWRHPADGQLAIFLIKTKGWYPVDAAPWDS